jgi:S-adenosylmethionine synthetase
VIDECRKHYLNGSVGAYARRYQNVLERFGAGHPDAVSDAALLLRERLDENS